MKIKLLEECPAIVLLVSLGVLGCDRQPQRAEVPPLDPAAIAAGAMSTYDVNGDGVIAGDELKAAASVTDREVLPEKLIDKDQDGQISQEEIQNRVQQWIHSEVGILMFDCIVHLDGKPLEGATVKYVPESFMGGAVDEASGVTDSTGTAVIAIDQAKLPEHLKGIYGVRTGFYRVEITHPTRSIPAKYNTQTILGHEIATDSIDSLGVVHNLQAQ